MDPWSLQAANALAGNVPGAAALEWGVGGGVLQVARDLTLALAGADVEATLGGRPVASWRTLRARAGDRLELGAPRRGRFAYVAIGGGLHVPTVLGSAATYLPAAIGGMDGRRLRDGDLLRAADAPPIVGGARCPAELRLAIAGWATSPDEAPVRVTDGPQADLLDAEGWSRLT